MKTINLLMAFLLWSTLPQAQSTVTMRLEKWKDAWEVMVTYFCTGYAFIDLGYVTFHKWSN